MIYGNCESKDHGCFDKAKFFYFYLGNIIKLCQACNWQYHYWNYDMKKLSYQQYEKLLSLKVK